MTDRRLILPRREHEILETEFLANAHAEIGRVLAGRIVDGDFLVAVSIPAGPAATRSPVRFSPDFAWQQILLDFLHERFGLDYLGDIHTHPGLMDVPSDHDLRTARHIVTDKAWNKPVAVFPIAVVDGGRVRMRAYFMRRESLEFEEAPITIAPDTDPRIVAVLNGSLATTLENHREEDTTNESSRQSRHSTASGLIQRLKARLWNPSPR